MKRLIKRIAINGYLLGLIPAKAVAAVFKLIDLKHE